MGAGIPLGPAPDQETNMRRILQNIGRVGVVTLAVGGVLVGCNSYGSVGGVTDGTPAHQPAATEAEAMQRCAKLIPERQQECIAIVKARFHDTSK